MKLARVLLCAALLGGCSSTLPPVDETHPASPNAPEASVSAVATVLDTEPGATRPATVQQNAPAAGTKYTCKHHPEVISDQPGNCPKCGMKLTPLQPVTSRPAPAGAHEHSSHDGTPSTTPTTGGVR
jgi:hypothetical protein